MFDFVGFVAASARKTVDRDWQSENEAQWGDNVIIVAEGEIKNRWMTPQNKTWAGLAKKKLCLLFSVAYK